MSSEKASATAPALSLKQIAQILGEAPRWIVLRELAKGEALPVHELARRAGRSADAMSKQMGIMRRYGVIVTGYGGLYTLAPAYRPAPGATTLDLGHALIRLDIPPAAPAAI